MSPAARVHQPSIRPGTIKFMKVMDNPLDLLELVATQGSSDGTLTVWKRR
jgi:hypothetical protein